MVFSLQAVESHTPRLKVAAPASEAAVELGSATPRSTYKNTSEEARDAVQKSVEGGGARSMLHKHVASMAYA